MSIAGIINFFRFSNLLNPRPFFISSSALNVLLVSFSLLFLAGIGVTVIIRQRRKDYTLVKAMRQLQYNFFTVSLIGFLYVWFRYENVYVLSARAWLAILFFVFVGWLAYGVYILTKRVPAYKQERQRQKEFEKYLP